MGIRRNARFAISGWLVAGVVALLLAGACGAASSNARPVFDRPALPRLAFDLPSLNGGRLNAETLRGRYVVLKPFAAWCKPCWSELPLLVDASEQFWSSRVSFVAVSFDKERAATQNLVTKLRVPFPVALDPQAQLARPLALPALTPLYLFGPEGDLLVRYAHCDRGSIDDLVQRLVLLTQRASPTLQSHSMRPKAAVSREASGARRRGIRAGTAPTRRGQPVFT